MSKATKVSKISATTLVAADPATAFTVFTEEVDTWWKRGPRFRPSVHGAGVLRFEGGVGGRLLETYDNGSSFEFGRVTVWQPGERLVMQMMARNLKPGEFTEVEIRFKAEGDQTRVTVEHRGWEKFPADHPVLHGMSQEAFGDAMGVWWGDLLVAIQARIAGARKQARP
jgi:uncharacterized protein YndB with AHSA1/START domain